MKRFKVFLLNSLLMVGSSFVLQIIRLLFNIYVSNQIAREALGVFQLIMTAYTFGITLAASGINITSTRIVSEEMAIGNNYGIKKSIIKCILISLTFGFMACIIFCLNSSFIVKVCFHSKVSESIVYLIAIALPMIAISASISGYFTAVRRVYKSVVANFLEYVAKIIITVFLLQKYLPSGSIENICFALILGDVLSEVCSFTYNIIVFTLDLNHNIGNRKITKSNSFVYRIFRILLPVAVTSYIRSGLSTLKQLIIPSSLEKNGIHCEKALAEYGTITGMAMPIVMFPATFLTAVSGLLIPEFSRYYVKKDYLKIKQYSDKLIVGSFLFALLLSGVFIVFVNALGEWIYRDASVGVYIKLFAPLIPFMYVDIIVDNILKGLDAQVNVLFTNIVDLLVSISFIFFFVPWFGIKGFIASVFASEMLNFALSLKKLLDLQKSWN